VSALDGIGHEWQRAIFECIADEFGCDVEDPVAESVLGSRGAVMGFVRVQEMELSRQANTPGAAVVEGLHADSGDADRVRVVSVRLEGAGAEVDGRAFETGRTWPGANRVASPFAGSFKTIGIDAS
jgi:hypothetical protein